MTDSKEIPKIEKNNSKNKNLFKRFKINLEDFKIEKSDFDEKFSDNENNEEDLQDLDLDNKKIEIKKETVNEFKEEEYLIFKENNTEKNFKDHQDNNKNIDQELPYFEENEIANEKLFLSLKIIYSKIKEIIFEDSERKFHILPISGLAIGILFIIMGILIFLGNSDKVVDNVSFGETSSASVLIGFVGIILLALSLLKMFPNEKIFGNIFNLIQDFESETNENNQDTENNKKTKVNKNDETDSKSQDEDGIIKKMSLNSLKIDSKSEDKSKKNK